MFYKIIVCGLVSDIIIVSMTVYYQVVGEIVYLNLGLSLLHLELKVERGEFVPHLGQILAQLWTVQTGGFDILLQAIQLLLHLALLLLHGVETLLEVLAAVQDLHETFLQFGH